MRHGLFLPPFDELADPHRLVELAVLAESSGWDGFFLWDHLTYPAPVSAILDPYVCLSAVATATSRMAIGPMITPLTKRTLAVVARQALALDALSHGRLIMGFGLGDDPPLGERDQPLHVLNGVERGRALSEAVALFRDLLRGDARAHDGEYYQVPARTFVGGGTRSRDVPIWLGARWPHQAPLRRAAAYDGAFEIFLDGPENVAEVRSTLQTAGANLEHFDVVVWSGAIDALDAARWSAQGVTWLLRGAGPFNMRFEEIRDQIAAGPRRE
ncbi:MAG: LLM class flavin-dependent oxidoreductase [Acidobacteriota bacterium]|nr:LLM class flavin-dependent oxidoreductase [Acidobacteriota bacterium]MDE3043396.1 LLM class flavin-dependent oxidoreductase [Acidobacteriota bacterium]MDE3107291.1 LLM class flavin-dependent oxidoreductase [Acidobacteriota bacterium]MDE3221970.1 LLM class flavin-dependent oxidoreductase [Acidobacteriota bacterium]